LYDNSSCVAKTSTIEIPLSQNNESPLSVRRAVKVVQFPQSPQIKNKELGDKYENNICLKTLRLLKSEKRR